MGIHVRRQVGATRLWLVAVAAVAAGGATFVLPRTISVHADPNTPQLIQAQALTANVAEITWTAVSGATGYKVFDGGSQVASGTATMFDHTGLTQLSSHSYTVVATVGGIDSAATNPVAVTMQQTPPGVSPSTPPAPTVVQTPATPSGVVAGSLSLSWTASTGGAKGYRVYRTDQTGNLATLALIATTDHASYVASGLLTTPGPTTYAFEVQSIGPNGEASAMSGSGSGSPAAPLATPLNPAPPASTAFGVNDVVAFNSSRIDVTWGDSPSAASPGVVRGYQVTRDATTIIATVLDPQRNHFSDELATDPGFTAGSHSYTITTIGVDGTTGGGASVSRSADTTTATTRVVRGPYVQSITGTSARIAWWTNNPTTSAVNYGTTVALGTSVIDATPTAAQHAMLIGPLTPGQIYQYQVGATAGTTSCPNASPAATCQFTAAAAPGTAFTFDALGDYGGGSGNKGPAGGQGGNATNIIADAPSFVQTLGDNVYPDGQDPNFLTTYSDFDHHLYKNSTTLPMGKLLANMGFSTANGNVDYYSGGGLVGLHGTATMAPAYFNNMWQPNNQQWFSYDWGDAHITVLDSEQNLSPGSAQYNFLIADLNAHQGNVWRIIVVQNPPYSSLSPQASATEVHNLVPVFQNGRVQLVLSGNSHNYERTNPLFNDTPVSGSQYGITYVVSGAGGNGFNKFSNSNPQSKFCAAGQSCTATREDTVMEHLKITVSPTQLIVSAQDGVSVAPCPATGCNSTFDSITLQAAVTPTPSPTPGPTPTPTPTPGPGPGSNPGSGYWLVATDGGIFPFGKAVGYGSTGNIHLNKPIVGMATTASGKGYWLVATDGGIFPFGDAVNHSYGSTGGIHLNQPIVGMARTASGNGYWLVATDGGIFPFGDAVLHSYGSTGGIHLNQPIVGMARTASGNGYWLVATDGGIFPFGDAVLHSYGSTGGMHLNQPIVGMAPTGSGNGYWLVATDGGIFPFGDAGGYGSTGNIHLNQPIVGMAATPDGGGYWLVATDGGIFPFGDAPGFGSTGNIHLNQPIVGMTAF